MTLQSSCFIFCTSQYPHIARDECEDQIYKSLNKYDIEQSDDQTNQSSFFTDILEAIELEIRSLFSGAFLILTILCGLSTLSHHSFTYNIQISQRQPAESCPGGFSVQ